MIELQWERMADAERTSDYAEQVTPTLRAAQCETFDPNAELEEVLV